MPKGHLHGAHPARHHQVQHLLREPLVLGRFGYEGRRDEKGTSSLLELGGKGKKNGFNQEMML